MHQKQKSGGIFLPLFCLEPEGGRFFPVMILACLLLFPGPDRAAAGSDPGLAGLLVNRGGFAVERDGRILLEHDIDQQFIPASIGKIITSLAALHILGPDYRFATRFYLDGKGDLFIKGSGDPFLVSEEVRHILARLKSDGLTINNILLDDSAFALESEADGIGNSDNPYDALNSALAVNFNTVNITVTDRGVSSAEEQTPTLPLMKELAAGLAPGVHRFNISRGNGDAGILRHTGELFRALQRELGIPGDGRIERMEVPPNLQPVYVHQSSKNLLDIIPELMHFSNNFIANQLFLACGVQKYGLPATWQKGRMAMREYLEKELTLAEKDAVMVEGSGLSRRNRISARAMLTVLRSFKPHAGLLPEKDGALVKSGTLTGVFSYAGYFQDRGRQDGFVIILNQPRNNRDRLLGILKKRYMTQPVR